jgi:hypothetical protein
MPQDHWLLGFNFSVEEWDAEGAAEKAAEAPDILGRARTVY